MWVFGGYTAYLKRSSLIERYIIKDNCWESVDFRMSQGFEAGHIITTEKDNEIIIIGGKIYGGECEYVHLMDLKNQTIINKR
jgi:hypothetical protein